MVSHKKATKSLVIVESPAKATTIARIIGDDFTVRASYGHVRDLPKTKIGVDVKKGFEPDYLVSLNKQTIRALKEIETLYDRDNTQLYLATDEDREGESIGWHIMEILQPTKAKKVQRVVFHEITKEAILRAFEKPRVLNMDLVDAQQARRVLDRLVGYELSPVLWKTVRRGLSAGRVQSVALRLIADRENEINAFNPEVSYVLNAEFKSPQGRSFQAELSKKFSDLDAVRVFLESCRSASFSIKDLQKKTSKRSPAPPFTTSTLQQEAARKLGFTVKKTMVIAQRLYETGKITYMRTDSVQMAQSALDGARQEIEQKFGQKYAQTRQYKTKSASAQEAHEAIRPTDFTVLKAGENRNEERLYELIWKRAIASQMSDAILDRTTATIAVSNQSLHFIARGEIIVFDGFLKTYRESTDNGDEDQKDAELPILHVGDALSRSVMTAFERYSRPPFRYSEAALVRKLEELGIGRPSTYAPTISTIIEREYVVIENKPGRPISLRQLTLVDQTITEEIKDEIVGSEKSKLVPTLIGTVVNDFLVKHFPDIVDYQFTARIEKQFDEIAAGKQNWKKMIADFYVPFHTSIIEKKATVSRAEMLPSRLLGTDPKTGKPVSVKMGPYGLYVQLGDKNDSEKPKFASLPAEYDLNSITFEAALALFSLPRKLGQDEDGHEIIAHQGPYGPYVKAHKTIVSIAPLSPFEITLEQARTKLLEKRDADRQKIIKQFPETNLSILNGRWGAYITDGHKNAKIPKSVANPEQLTAEQCLEILEKPKRGRRPPRKK
ncbi:type I DNA topoisomerase [bacterium]|nr:type I DNA topoisomerase [bacterium]